MYTNNAAGSKDFMLSLNDPHMAHWVEFKSLSLTGLELIVVLAKQEPQITPLV